MARYRHYRNSKEPGVTLFATTTVLDFVHAFRRDEPRDAMVRLIALECRRAHATLHAYVVMPHHVHLLIKLHEKMSGPQFMQRFKIESSAAISGLLTPEELRQFADQRGLNRHLFWQDSFRSVEVLSEVVFRQKIGYIHLNPVKAEYVEVADDYRWSSARLMHSGLWSDEAGLRYEDVLRSLES